jgi:hypothetical protein
MFTRISFRTISLALIAALILQTVAVGAQMVVAEDAYETDSAQVMLPSTIVGSIFVRNCEICNQDPFQLSDETKFVIGSQMVPYSEFKRAVEAGHRIMTVMYKPHTRRVTRLLM